MGDSFEKKWKRPKDLAPFPHVWSSFPVTRDGNSFNVRIQDVTVDQYEEVWDMLKENFYLDEEVIRTANQIEDEVTMNSQRFLYYNQYIKDNLSIVAVVDNEDGKPTIVGALVLEVVSKDDPPHPEEFPGVTRAKIQNLFKILHQNVDEFGKLNVDKIFKDYMIAVKREYRRLGIGSELFLAMEKMAKTFDIPAAVVIFMNDSSQAFAAKLGYTVFSEVKLKDYVDEDGQEILPCANTKTVQLCYKYLLK